jgi:hypothetical protein
MDPASIALIFGAAKTAYEAIKTGIKVGKEIQGMAGDIAKLYGSVSSLTKLSAEPPKPKMFSKVSAEEMAMDIVVKRKQAEEWFAQVKNEFVGTYGIAGWHEVEKELVRIQKEQKAARERAAKEAEEFQREVMIVCLIGGSVVAIIIGVFLVALAL